MLSLLLLLLEEDEEELEVSEELLLLLSLLEEDEDVEDDEDEEDDDRMIVGGKENRWFLYFPFACCFLELLMETKIVSNSCRGRGGYLLSTGEMCGGFQMHK